MDKHRILRKLLSRAYATEFKRFLDDIDYIRSQCQGCVIGHEPMGSFSMSCLSDLAKKISLSNVHSTFLALSSQACIDPNHAGFDIDGKENVFDKDNPQDTDYAWVQLVSESYEDLCRKNEIEKCIAE